MIRKIIFSLSFLGTLAVVAQEAYTPDSTGGYVVSSQDPSQVNKQLDMKEDQLFHQSGVIKPINKDISLDSIESKQFLATIKTKEDEDKDDKVPLPREEILKESAATYGARAGLSHRAYEINLDLAGKATNLDTIYNFRYIMLEEGVLPPVLSEGINAYKQPKDDEVRAAGQIYKIEFPARFVSTPPTWRSYLIQSALIPETPDDSVLPKTKGEAKIWDKWVAIGWYKGIEQSNYIFTASLGRLRRDFEGMIRFKTLYAKGMVSRPIIARTNLGVTGGGDELKVDDRIFKITEKAQLNSNPRSWGDTSVPPAIPPP